MLLLDFDYAHLSLSLTF